jgi:mono/diheme cytochrome c family protein
MKKWIVFTLLAAAVWACGSSNQNGSASDASAEAPPPPDGQKLYKQNCVICHGLYGDMGASGAHDLTASELPLEERIAVITNGRNAMTPFKALLSPDQIEAVAEYTLTLKE